MSKLFTRLAIAFFIIFMSFGSAFAVEDSGFNISGFVDASYFVNNNDDGVNGADYNSFSFDQAEIDITKEIKDWASLRFDLEHMDSAGAIEQGYLTLTAPVGEGVTFTFGKFNAPIGFELLDPVDMYQFSHALVFNYGLPTNLTGGMLSTAFSIIDISVYLANGWDNNTDGNNKNKTIGGRIGITPIEGINFGISGNTGEINETERLTLSVFDIDGTITVVPNLTIGMEFNYGWQDGASIANDANAKWLGFLLMGHYDYSSWGGITLRYDYFDDMDGARLNDIRSAEAKAAGITSDMRQAITISPTFVIGEGFGALFEYRHDFSDKNVFTKGDGANTLTDNNDTFAFEMTYSF